MKKTRKHLATPLAAVLLAAFSNPSSSQPSSEPLPPPNPLKNAYFGDLHLHTSLSFDAATMKTNTLPEDSYRFAQGEAVDYLGQKIQRRAPLDFLAVTDHAEYLGVMRGILDPKGPHAGTDWHKLLANPDPKVAWEAVHKLARTITDRQPIAEFVKDDQIRSNWQVEIDAAEKYYRPGKFTTFIAYEWTSFPDFQNLHRNVIFRTGKVAPKPFSSIDSQRPEDLWTFLDNNRRNGIEALDIPHNANASNGLMLADQDSDGNPISREYAEQRARNEPVFEVDQAKGQSETHPLLSPNDEFANFELWELLLATNIKGKIDGSYIRQGYGKGQEIEARTGVNPFKYGLVGASDFHSGVTSTEENNFPGAHGFMDSNPKTVLTDKDSPVGPAPVIMGAAGLTGVWAEQNTREAIFDALKRKEVFATSGNRIKVRLFGGWGYEPGLTAKPEWVKDAYAAGVPMGADLPARPANGKAPRFIVDAVKDPDAGNLDRVQIVKVWTKNGESHEKVYDVAWSGGARKIDPRTGKLEPIASTVDLKTATYTNSVGAVELATVWEDPEFDPEAQATYYARVLEIPTPRWSTVWAVKYQLPLSDLVSPTLQERAWTSPVFYKPS
jgi:hypothetical protein